MLAHRVAAKRWMSAVDNQLKSSALAGGLAEFVWRADGAGDWGDWRRWPHLTCSLDLGSDGLSAYQALERKFVCNIDKLLDASHGTNRCMILGLQQSGLYSLWLRLMINNNLAFGPNRGSHRY
jgi:hypothetical protein